MSAPIEVRKLSAALGAEILGADLAHLDEATFSAIQRAFLDHGAIFFRDQKLTPEAQIAFARRFGEPEVHPIVKGSDEFPELIEVFKPAGESASFGIGWHTDNSFFEEPSLGSVLHALEVPPHGGDTLFASTERAYAALSPKLRAFCDDLEAVHSASRAYDPRATGDAKYRGEAPITYRYDKTVIDAEVTHPVVRTHPETGRKSLYVNPMFTQHVVDLNADESTALLEFLYAHIAKPEFQCRFLWSKGAVAFWDNRCVWHYAMDDYREYARRMNRVTIAGERPV